MLDALRPGPAFVDVPSLLTVHPFASHYLALVFALLLLMLVLPHMSGRRRRGTHVSTAFLIGHVLVPAISLGMLLLVLPSLLLPIQHLGHDLHLLLQQVHR